MADFDHQMSIVPYNHSREVVLRHNDAVVVYDRASQQLQLQDASQTQEELHLPRLCPYCHRPFQEDNDSDIGDEHGGRAPTATGYVDPNYFAMLDSSQSPSASRPGTSGNQLMPYVVDEGDEDYNAVNNSLTSAGISPQSFNDGFFRRNFIKERVLGKGGKGIVLLVKHVLGTNDLGQFACKRVPVGDSPEWLRKVLVEVQTLKKLSHHNLAPYHHAWLEHAKVSSFGPTVPCVFILQRYCEAGDLHRYVCGPGPSQHSPQELKARMRRRSKGQPELPSGLGGPRKLQIEAIYSLFKDITNGLRYLHKKNLIHRDLKPSNCLLTMEANKLHAVVSDFGEVQSEDAVRASTGSTGTVSYCAPEVLQRVAPQGPYGNFTYKSDIFSLGMVLYFLCFATLPYVHADVNDEDNEDLDQLRDEVCQWSGFDDAQRLRPELPDKVYWLLARLLAQSPEKRPTCKEIFDLMKKHNNWDIAHEDRRPSLNPAIEMPQISPVRRGREESGSPVSHRGSVSPRIEKSSSSRTPELEGLAGNSATIERDYGTLSPRPELHHPAQDEDNNSLVLSRRGHSEGYRSGSAEQSLHDRPDYRRKQPSPEQSDDLAGDRPYKRLGDRADEHSRTDDRTKTSPDQRTPRYEQGSHFDAGYRFPYIFSRRGFGSQLFGRTMEDQARGAEDSQHRQSTATPTDNGGGFLNYAFLGPPDDHRDFISRCLLATPLTRQCLQVCYGHPVIADLVAFAFFLLKIFSMTVPCAPHAPRPSIFYPLIILATVDFSVVSLPFHVFALMGHVVTVGLARGLDSMCVGV